MGEKRKGGLSPCKIDNYEWGKYCYTVPQNLFRNNGGGYISVNKNGNYLLLTYCSKLCIVFVGKRYQ